jgi:hypothetical protein
MFTQLLIKKKCSSFNFIYIGNVFGVSLSVVKLLNNLMHGFNHFDKVAVI